MTVKYLHVREVDENMELMAGGGLTVAYTVTDVEGMQQIFLNWVKCHPDDHFEYKVGRELASKRLKDEGPFEILDLEHPISEALIDWIATCLWPAGPESIGQGYAIDIIKDEKGRWVSDFIPSQSAVDFEQEENLLDNAHGE